MSIWLNTDSIIAKVKERWVDTDMSTRDVHLRMAASLGRKYEKVRRKVDIFDENQKNNRNQIDKQLRKLF